METQVLERVKRMAKEDTERLYDLICIKQNENSSRSYCKVRPCNDFLFQIKDRIGILSKNNKRGPTKDPKDGGTGRKRAISLLQWEPSQKLAGRPALWCAGTPERSFFVYSSNSSPAPLGSGAPDGEAGHWQGLGDCPPRKQRAALAILARSAPGGPRSLCIRASQNPSRSEGFLPARPASQALPVVRQINHHN